MTTNSVALVTGANKGLGLATSRQLAQQGITVLMGARSAAKGNNDKNDRSRVHLLCRLTVYAPALLQLSQG